MRTLLAALVATGCATSAPRMSPSPAAGLSLASIDGERGATRVASVDRDRSGEEREVARAASLEVTRDDPENGAAAFAELAKSHAGYAEELRGDRALVRVPADDLDAFLTDAAKLGEVTSKRVVARDLTEGRTDLRIRIDNLEKSRQRFRALFDKAANVAEAATIERELARVTTELECLQAQLAHSDRSVKLAAVEGSFARKIRPGPIGWVFYGFFRGVKWLLVWD